MSPLIFSALIAGAILTGAVAIVMMVTIARRQTASGRMQRRLSGTAGMGAEFEDAQPSLPIQLLAALGRALDKGLDEGGETARLLVQAGWRSQRARALYYSLQGLTPILLIGGAALVWVFGPESLSTLEQLAIAFGAVALGLLGPRWVLRSRAEKRRARIKNEVPLFIHVLSLLFEAGLSTRQALSSLVREGSGVLPVLGEEIEVANRQLDAGGDTDDVLKSLGQHLAVPELISVLSVIRQVERYGGEVREPLMEALEVLEERRSLELRERVNLLSGRMTVVMVGFFFPALMVFVAGPAFVSIIKALGDVN